MSLRNKFYFTYLLACLLTQNENNTGDH